MQIFVIDWQDVLVDSSDLPTYLAATYQPLLVSGTSIKTINGQSLLGAGNIAISVDLSGYLPIAGGTLTGSIDMDGNSLLNADTVSAVVIDKNGLPVATEAYASNASNLASGTVSDNRLSANVPLKNAANTFSAAQVFSGQVSLSGSNSFLNFQGGSEHYLGGITYFRMPGSPFTAGVTVNGSTGVITIGAGVSIVRNATGPTAETRAAGGLKVCNADGSAVGPVQCSSVTASGSVLAAGGNAGCGGGGMALSWTGVSAGMIAGGQFIVYENGTNRMALIDSMGMHISSGHGIRFGSAASGSGSADVGLKRKASSPGVIEINNGTWGNSSGSIELTNLTLLGSYRPGQYTVATLPSAAANTGRTVQVTDSSVDFPGNIGNTVAGGGAFNVDVKSNGTNWRITG